MSTEPGKLEQRLTWNIADVVITVGGDKKDAPLTSQVDEGPGTPHPVTGYKYSSTQVNLSYEDAERVKQILLEIIPDDELDFNEGREEKPHVTVKYGLHTEDPYDVEKALEGIGPARATLGKISIFDTNPDYDVVKIDVQSADLRRLNKVIAAATEVTDTQPFYEPHLTLAYVKKGFGKKYVGMVTELTGLQLEFGYVLFSSRNGSETEILLSEIVHHDEWKFSEDQPRDEHGRWTGGSSAIGSEKVKTQYEKHIAKNLSDETKQQFKSLAEEIAKKNVYIAMTPSVLSKVLKEGDVKTQHETGHSGGLYSPNARARFEDEFFDGSRPVYGYLSDTGQASLVSWSYPDRGEPYLDDTATQYGDARILLKDNVRDRVTFIDGDSFDGNSGVHGVREEPNQLATRLNDPSYESIWPKGTDQYYKERLNDHERRSYIEAQIHGGVKASDIKSVVFYSKDPGKGLQSQLKKLGIS